jgi:hypothetical protein
VRARVCREEKREVGAGMFQRDVGGKAKERRTFTLQHTQKLTLRVQLMNTPLERMNNP